MITPLRQATILSDFEARVVVLPLGEESFARHADLHWSSGACFTSWGEAEPEELMFLMFQAFRQLVEEARIPVERVHRAFCVIPEYRATLEPHHPDALTEAEWRRFGIMMDLPQAFVAAARSVA